MRCDIDVEAVKENDESRTRVRLKGKRVAAGTTTLTRVAREGKRERMFQSAAQF